MPRQIIRDFGTCLQFDGSSYVVLSGSPSNAIDNFTFASWIKPQLPQTTGMIFSNGRDGEAGYDLGVGAVSDASGSKLIALIMGFAWIDSTIILPNGVWSLVAMSVRSGVMYLYAISTNNRQSVEQNVYSGSIFAPANFAAYGTEQKSDGSKNRKYKGLMDDPMFFSNALSQAQLDSIFFNGITNAPARAMRHNMNEGSGSALVATEGTITGAITGATYSSDVVIKPRTLAS